MSHLFDDIVFTVRGHEYAYRAHTLATDEATHGGFATAALVAVWMLGTDEAAQRGLTSLVTPEERTRIMDQYEAETFREDGGLLMSEIEDLYWWLWHIDIENEDDTDGDSTDTILQLGLRQQSLWSMLINEYMTRLVDRWADSVISAEDSLVDCKNYLDFLLSHLAAYSRIQRMREIRWCDRYSVEEFWTLSSCNHGWIVSHIDLCDIITHLPADVDEQALMARYFTLRRTEHAQRRSKPNASRWYAVEQEPLDAAEVLSFLSAGQIAELDDYHRRWLHYLCKRLSLVPNSLTPVIWTEKVNDALEDKLVDYLMVQEGTHAWARNTCAALFAMQQLQWLKPGLTVAEFRHWAARHLHRDYTTEPSRVALARWWYEWTRDDNTVLQHTRRLQEL